MLFREQRPSTGSFAASLALAIGFLSAFPLNAAEPTKLSVLLLGDKGHHNPAEFAKVIGAALGKVGIDVSYTDKVEDLVSETLNKYDAVAIFRDSGELPAKNEVALLEYVESGKGLVPIHCASHCFRNSDRYTALVGGRFFKHETGVFRAKIIDAQHPAMRGVKSFESWDETYVHNQLGNDLRVLMVREERGGGYEPYTWVRDQGQGRVFYTALGHDERTWKNEGYQKLLEAGIRWAAGQTKPPANVKPFEYVEANVPNYLAGAAWGTVGEPIRKMQKPLEPAESIKHFHLPEGFEIQLYASEPDIARPIAMTWDERGRLWIAETVDYPNNRQSAGKGHDRIKICEDTKGAGKADKFTIFADKLSIPTSLAFANGGLIVTQAPDTLFIKSSANDDHADMRKVLFTGWGTSDTHAGPSNLRRGLDNWIWGTVGYSGFNGEVGGKKYRFGQNIFRFKPDGSQLEVLTSTSNNTWGLGISETGEIFASTANNQHSVQLAIPNRAFEGVRGWYGLGSREIEDHKKFHPITKSVRQVDFHGGFTAAAGSALYTARSFPQEYWNRVSFVCEPTGHLVHMDWLVPQGSTYTARDGWNILTSDDEWSAPIMAEVGPDGALWVIDWYNYIVQHNPTPTGFKTGKGGAYETPLRDKTHGRIYRIVYTGAKPASSPLSPVLGGEGLGVRGPLPRLSKDNPKELIAALSHENMFWRLTAQRLLLDRGNKDVVPQLLDLVKDPKNGPGALHALWTLDGLGALTDSANAGGSSDATAIVQSALGHADPAVRRAALQVLPHTAASVKAILAAKSLKDDDAQVRLAALLALGEMPGSKDAATAIAAVLEEPRNATDRWISLAAVSAAAPSDLHFLEAVAAAQPKPEVERSLVNVIRPVAGHLARRAPMDAASPLLAGLAKAKAPLAEAMLTGLASGWPPSDPVKLDDKASADLASLPAKLSTSGISQLATLLKKWGQQDKLAKVTEGIKAALLIRVADEKATEDLRVAAARDLISLGSDEPSIAAVMEQINAKATPTFTRGILEALGQSTSDEMGTSLISHWAELTPTARKTALALLLQRPAWAKAVLSGIEKGVIDNTDLGIDQAQQLSKHPDKAIAERANKLLASGGRLPNPDRQKVLDGLLPLAKRHGDKAKGKVVFENNCAKCHRHGNLGQVVGPDLTGMAVRDRADLLIDILDPNRSVEGNYRQYTVETKKGLTLTGLLTAETRTAVELLDSEAKKHIILREDIDNLISSKLSLMPEGFEKLPEEDLVSLLDFLSARDKYIPLPLGKSATIASNRGMFTDRNNEAERLVFETWGPQTFAGVPFQVIDPRGGSIPNVILLAGPGGRVSKDMPKAVTVPCNLPAKNIHLLSGVSGWGFPYGKKGTVSMIVRLHYADRKTEDHPLQNGIHFADYIRVVDVPESKLAFKLRAQQIRYLAITPKHKDKIDRIEFVKGEDESAPVVMAVTVEVGE
ncbi:MAG: PVC-type heme-binding CxxCH protein [Gemmataceae bacterium]